MSATTSRSTQPLTELEAIGYIWAGALRRGLDPYAVLADAKGEGLSGTGTAAGIGDNGTSFGPFQLHFGGAYPAGAPTTPAAAQAWASSPQGIDYALNRIQQVAQGKKGTDALAAIVSGFERPSDVSGAIATRSRYYNQIAGQNLSGVVKQLTGVSAQTPHTGIGDFLRSPTGDLPGEIVQGGKDIKGGGEKALTKWVSDLTGWLTSVGIRVAEAVGGFILLVAGLYLLAKQIGLPAATPPQPVQAVTEAV